MAAAAFTGAHKTELLAVGVVDLQAAAFQVAGDGGNLGDGAKAQLSTMADKLDFVLYYDKTYPPFDVLGAQFDYAAVKSE